MVIDFNEEKGEGKMKNRKNVLKEASVILIIAVFVLSSTAVIGENENKQTKLETCLTEVSQSNTIVINKDPMTGGRAILWDNGLPDGVNGLSCIYWPSHVPLWDRYLIDDFTVPYPGWIVNDGHFRIVTDLGSDPSAIKYVYYYFFKSTGPCVPDTNALTWGGASFSPYFTGNTYFYRPEIAVDCQFTNVTLTPGEYWVCFQPQMDENCFWLTAPKKGCSVFLDYPDIPYPRWTWGFNVFGVEYDVSWRLTGELVPIPDISCGGLLSWPKVKTGSIVSGTFPVTNSGQPGSLLNWEVDTSTLPTWGTSWTFTPSNGTGLADGASAIITATVVAPPQKKTKFTGKIKINNSDNPSDFCEIDVSLTTPRARTGFNLLQLIQEKYPNMFPVLRHILA